MEKNWLIRTKSNHILGPVSREKVLELYQNGTIKLDDEVCSGNGFWFYIREDEMVDRFLKGSDVQGFNPISEAKDVLTFNNRPDPVERSAEDITLVGGINLSHLKEPPKEDPPKPAPSSDRLDPGPGQEPGAKKKITSEHRRKSPEIKPVVLKKQSYLRYLGYVGFILLFLLLYFRKNIIRNFLQSSFTLMESAYAQDEGPAKKKKLLESSVTILKVTFSPVANLDGFRVTSSLDVTQMTCADLSSDVYQLALILFPSDVFNEKFLIKLRDCVLKLRDDHPVKKWLKSVAGVEPPSAGVQKRNEFLSEILNSQYNLITDLKVKNKIIQYLDDVPQNSLLEKLLKSYLYLMIGNVTRSDNILREIVRRPPVENWTFFNPSTGSDHELAKQNMSLILTKLAKHPSDRRMFQLFLRYLKSFFNDPLLLEKVNSVLDESLDEKLTLEYNERTAPELVHYLRLARSTPAARIKHLRRSSWFNPKDLMYWVIPFLDVEPLISDAFLPALGELEKENPLWFLYVLDLEKLSDLYSRRSHFNVSQRRMFLREKLKGKRDFMLSLYKLLEFGDIDSAVVQEAANYLVK